MRSKPPELRNSLVKYGVAVRDMRGARTKHELEVVHDDMLYTVALYCVRHCLGGDRRGREKGGEKGGGGREGRERERERRLKKERHNKHLLNTHTTNLKTISFILTYLYNRLNVCLSMEPHEV